MGMLFVECNRPDLATLAEAIEQSIGIRLIILLTLRRSAVQWSG